MSYICLLFVYRHLSFVVTFARLYASVCGIPVTEQVSVQQNVNKLLDMIPQDCTMDAVQAILSAVVVPEYKPSSKVSVSVVYSVLVTLPC